MTTGVRTLAFCIGTLAMVGASGPTAGQDSPSARAFAQLASLAGEWQGVVEGTEVQLSYKVIADGSVLLEEFRPKNSAMMLTLFSVDGDRVLATHYCSARNQPQMATAAITEPTSKSLAFSLLRVTGLRSPNDWHNTGLVVTLDDGDHLTQEWTYQHKGETGRNVFRFTRAR